MGPADPVPLTPSFGRTRKKQNAGSPSSAPVRMVWQDKTRRRLLSGILRHVKSKITVRIQKAGQTDQTANRTETYPLLFMSGRFPGFKPLLSAFVLFIILRKKSVVKQLRGGVRLFGANSADFPDNLRAGCVFWWKMRAGILPRNRFFRSDAVSA